MSLHSTWTTNNIGGVSTAASTTISGNYTMYPTHKRQRLNDDKPKDTTAATNTNPNNKPDENGATDSVQKTAVNGGFSNVGTLSLQKEQSWNTILGDVDSFGGLGPIPSMHAVLEKRASSQFSISSLLPSSMATSSTGQTSSSSATGRYENGSGDNGDGAHPETDASNAGQLPAFTEGSGGNQKYMDTTTGEYMYPENVKPMTFYEKQRLVQKITLLPSQYLRGLMDVISKYQPDTVRQIDDDGYAFDLGQMNENTVWAISDYVKDSMIELDGYIKSISSSSIVANDNQSTSSLDNSGLLPNQHSGGQQHSISENVLSNPKISAISGNENQGKFMEQVEMYSKPKITKSRVKPSKKHECPTCNKQFRGRSELQNHIRTHTGEKPLKCSYAGCTKRYAHSSNLRAHERTHAGVKPYACHYDGCGKSFAHSVSLKEHIWMHAGFQPYVCPYEGCEKKFTQVSNFARHKKTHEKEERSENEQSVESDN